MLATQQSMGNSLRWMRRGIVIILITANLMAVFLAETAAATQSLPSFPNVWNQHGVNLFVHYNPSLGIDDIAIGLTGVVTEANTPPFGLTTR